MVTCKFNSKIGDDIFNYNIEFDLSSTLSLKELTNYLIESYNIPLECYEDLERTLSLFIDEEIKELQNPSHHFRMLKDEIFLDDLLSNLTHINLDHHHNMEDERPATKDAAAVEPLTFARCFESMIEYPGYAAAMLNMERTYAKERMGCIEKRDHQLGLLLYGINGQHIDTKLDYVTHEMAADSQENYHNIYHGKQYKELYSKYSDILDDISSKQKHDYFEILKSAYAHKINHLDLSTFICQFKNEDEIYESEDITQESFTVNFGTQYKVTHNVRLIIRDVLSLCSSIVEKGGYPERIQTAMSIYSNNLHAVVLLVNKCLINHSDITLQLHKICERSTEFHFNDYSKQIIDIVNDSLAERSSPSFEYITQISRSLKPNFSSKLTSISADLLLAEAEASISGGINKKDTRPQLEKDCDFKLGDIYVTKHSNLIHLHSIIHLVVDQRSLMPPKAIDSRHPAILAYRNIIEIAILNDISSISIPLLLSHSYNKEMNLHWCIQISELVLKCIKGYLIDLSDWQNKQSLDIQFIVPQGLPMEIFDELTILITQIYRMSNPVIEKLNKRI